MQKSQVVTRRIATAAALVAGSLVAAGSAHASRGPIQTIRADQLPALCQPAGPGGYKVTGTLRIVGGTANITDECDLSPQDGATIQIIDATINAAAGPLGDFDICYRPANCGATNIFVQIINSTITEGEQHLLTLRAAGATSRLQVIHSTLDNGNASSPLVVTSDGSTLVATTKFLNATPVIHGGVRCQSVHNTPVVTCS